MHCRERHPLKPRIHYSKASITDLEIQYATDAAANGWGNRCYEYIERFESYFKSHLGVTYAIATSSCTGALHMGLAALGVSRGDEVILADINWIASAAPITYLGATPILVDILPDTWCIDPAKVEEAITPKTKAIIAVHLYGNLCDMDALLAIGRKYNIPIIEDAAEAIGSIWHGKRAGSLGTFGTFSFHGTKTITTGEGGMFVTNDASLFEKVLTLSNHGRQRGQTKQFWPEMIGFKYKMSNLQAAVGCGQMERISALIEKKREIFQLYQQQLSDLPIKMNPEPKGTQNGYWMPTLMTLPSHRLDRVNLLNKFKSQNVDGRVFFWPLSTTGFFELRHDNNQANSIHENAVNLPSYYEIGATDITSVCSIIREHFRMIT
ncbi:MAG: DegT/DnrJ/EryC1/StrS family aminotransferase [Spirochaetes bacterium]|nr:DegT/DnrJ/EryC1/StrS family aminotransferase [Spirochaetota bacterium]